MPSEEGVGATVQQESVSLLTEIEGIGTKQANRLLVHFGSGRKVAKSACRYWGELEEVDGITEEKARSMFDRMKEAGVFHDLRGY